MRIDFSESLSANRQVNPIVPQPGEIWEISRAVQSPLVFSDEERQLYSESAQRFLEGFTPRYVMIVKAEAAPESETEWPIASVMLLSAETDFLSDVDLLIPSDVSGVGQDLLAQTWHVRQMLICNLLRPLGRRLSREIYDVLMSVGDHYHGLLDRAPSQLEIRALGLQVGTPLAAQQQQIQAFHQQEEAWSDVLSVPVAAYHTYFKAMKLTDAILDEALQFERSLKTQISLGRWLENIFEAGWMTLSDFLDTRAVHLALAPRNAEQADEHASQEITESIDRLSSERDEPQRRRTVKQLGLARGNERAVRALLELMRSTQDDETLWTAVESLWQIAPGNPAAGVSKVKLIDLEMQVAGQSVALAVALLQKSDGLSVLLRVYPTANNPYLPTELKLILLDASGQMLREVTARRTDVYIQLRFNGQHGEQFSVRVALGDASIAEDFAI